MARRGPKPSYLSLVDAAKAAEDMDSGVCGAPKASGGLCQRSSGWGTGTSVGRCRDHLDDGVKPESSVPCPLPLDDLQRQLWDDLVSDLRKLGLLKRAFWKSMYGLVVATASLHRAAQAMTSITVEGYNGSEKKHPAATIMNQNLSQVRQYSAELGLTPSAMAKVGFTPEKEESTLDRLISGE